MTKDIVRPIIDDIRDEIAEWALPDEMAVYLRALGVDRMQNMSESNHPARELIPQGLHPIICPGGTARCGTDAARIVRVAKEMPAKLRKRLEDAIERWVDEMDDIAKEAGQGKLPLQVVTVFKKTGPELNFGYAGPGHEHVKKGRARALAERDGKPFETKGHHDHHH